MSDRSPETGPLAPEIDPAVPSIGIRTVRGETRASARTVLTVRGHTLITDEPDGGDSGPTPLEMTLAGLCGCECVIIARCARAMGFAYRGVAIEAEGEVDRRGSRGVPGVRPYFGRVALRIYIESPEPPERLARLRTNVELRCPVMNLFTASGVEVDATWGPQPAPWHLPAHRPPRAAPTAR